MSCRVSELLTSRIFVRDFGVIAFLMWEVFLSSYQGLVNVVNADE